MKQLLLKNGYYSVWKYFSDTNSINKKVAPPFCKQPLSTILHFSKTLNQSFIQPNLIIASEYDNYLSI